MALIASYDFTGSDGASWPADWSISGLLGDIQSNSGRLLTAASSYAGTEATRATGPQNGELLFRWKWVTAGAERHCFITYRLQSGGATYYAIIIRADNAELRAGGTTITYGFQNQDIGTWYWTRVQWIANQHRVRIWADGATEPGTWLIDATDATEAGTNTNGIKIMALTGGAGDEMTLLVDDVSIWNTFNVGISRSFARQRAANF